MGGYGVGFWKGIEKVGWRGWSGIEAAGRAGIALTSPSTKLLINNIIYKIR